MKRIAVIGLLLLLIGVLLVGCVPGTWVKGNGKIETRDYGLSGFKRVEVSGAFEITVTQSAAYKVSVTTSNNLFDYLDINVVGDLLIIRPRPSFSFHFSEFKAVVNMPEFTGINISGASNGTVSGFTAGSSPTIEVSGASKLNMNDMKFDSSAVEVSGASRFTATINTNKCNIEVSGASTLTLSGSSDTVKMNVSGASSLRLFDFSINNADVSVSGASNASVTVSGNLDAEVSGASRLTYAGNPKLGKIDVSGASSLKPQ
jgi:hypothetical protein